jgi:hypothetical protein
MQPYLALDDRTMRIYLAGKMDLEYGSWRTPIVGEHVEWKHGEHSSERIAIPRWIKRMTDFDYDWEHPAQTVTPWTIGRGARVERPADPADFNPAETAALAEWAAASTGQG